MSGTYSLLVASSSGPSSAISSKFNIVAGAATALSIYVQPPTSVSAGSAFQVEVAVRDLQGNLVTNYSGKVTITLVNPGGASLGGTQTVSVVNGLANFTTLTINKAGLGYTLQAASASTSTPALIPTATNSFNVVAPATQLVINSQPPGKVAVNTPFTVIVWVEDANGNLVTGYNGTVKLSISGKPSGGTVTVSAVNGVATFNVTLTQSGTYTLLVTASGLNSATTTPITVTAASRFNFLGH